jgi:hypothetical protein
VLRQHQLASATAAQIDSYIDANVTDLASAKEATMLIAKLTILGVQR